jgi:hypothetical protein
MKCTKGKKPTKLFNHNFVEYFIEYTINKYPHKKFMKFKLGRYNYILNHKMYLTKNYYLIKHYLF